MANQPRLGAFLPDRYLQGFDDQLGSHVLRSRPAPDLLAARILHPGHPSSTLAARKSLIYLI
jgi:hypothetical protein